MMLHIRITVPMDGSYWGDVTDEQAQVCAQYHLDQLLAWAGKQWTCSDVRGELQPHIGDNAVRAWESYRDQADIDRPDIAERIGNRTRDTWTDDAEAALTPTTGQE